MNEELQSISLEVSQKLQSIIHNRVEQAKGFDESILEDLTVQLWRIIYEAKTLHKDYKEAGLTFNAIETEGALRIAKTIEGYLLENNLITGKIEENENED